MIEEDFENALEIVIGRTKATREEILGKSRKTRIQIGRHIVCWLMRNRGWSYPAIADVMDVCHGTIINSCRVINTHIEMDENFRKVWPELSGKQIVFQDSETRKENKRKLKEMVG
tara:strand:- start:140 stop:484 length:345 start_codon:yes stop_codon:yes gene_type:complete